MLYAGVADVVDCTTIQEHKHKYDRVFNMIGYPLQEGYPEKPMRQHLIQYFAQEMELEPKIWALAMGTPQIGMDLPKNYATLQVKTGWSVYKEWPIERWMELVKRCPEITFIQIGAADDPKIPGAIHSYMGYQLMLSVSLIANAKMHVGQDSFGNHVTNYWWQDKKDAPLRRVPAVVLFGSTQANASGYKHNTNISLGLDCQPCFKEDPAFSTASRGPCENPPEQSYQHPRHACMYGISVDTVTKAVKDMWTAVTE
jgi:ADP-heptose:LPS heptosyltransferase